MSFADLREVSPCVDLDIENYRALLRAPRTSEKMLDLAFKISTVAMTYLIALSAGVVISLVSAVGIYIGYRGPKPEPGTIATPQLAALYVGGMLPLLTFPTGVVIHALCHKNHPKLKELVHMVNCAVINAFVWGSAFKFQIVAERVALLGMALITACGVLDRLETLALNQMPDHIVETALFTAGLKILPVSWVAIEAAATGDEHPLACACLGIIGAFMVTYVTALKLGVRHEHRDAAYQSANPYTPAGERED